MKEVKIFVACAKKLSREREALKVAANDLTAHYQNKEGKKISIVVNTYMNLDERQEDYNDFIRNTADVVLFILDDRIGAKTEEEFKCATEMLNKANHPEIVVFLRSFVERTPEINHIEDLLRDNFGRYYKNYNSEDDLKALAKDKIREFVDQQIRERKNVSFAHWKTATISLGIAFLACLGFWGIHMISETKPVLFVVGGGSAAEYLKKNYNVNLDNFKEGYYVHMPSGAAWTMLSDEVKSKQEPRRYYPICLSADTIDKKDLLKNYEKTEFLDAAVAISVYIGDDTLSVRMTKSPALHSFTCHTNTGKIVDAIEADSLLKIVKNREQKGITVFTTSMGSGTRKTYEKLFHRHDTYYFFEKDSTGLFSQFSDNTVRDTKTPYLLLGSRYYTLNALDGNPSVDDYYVVEGPEKKFVTKPTYVIFLAERISEMSKSSKLVVPKPVLDFVCGISEKVADQVMSKINKDGTLKNPTKANDVVMPLDDL